MNRDTAKKVLTKTTEDYKTISEEFIQTRIKPWPVFNIFKKYIKDNGAVLDVGCGTGRLIEIFKGGQIEYTGFDSSEASINFAKKTYGSFLEKTPNFFIKDIADIPWLFADKSFDAVFLIAVFHHIPGKEFRQEVLKEVKRVLKPGGKLIMTNWNLRSFWAIKKFWPEILRIYFPRKDPARHASQLASVTGRLDKGDFFAPWKLRSGKRVFRFYHSFSLKEIKKEIEAAGLDVLDNYYNINTGKTNWFLGDNILTVSERRQND